MEVTNPLNDDDGKEEAQQSADESRSFPASEQDKYRDLVQATAQKAWDAYGPNRAGIGRV